MFFMGNDKKMLHCLKSPPCNEMMAFYFQIFKFDSRNVID